MNDNPVYSTFAEFTQRCLGENQFPFFIRAGPYFDSPGFGKIDEFICGLKPIYPRELENYFLDTRASYPFCRELRQDFQILLRSGFLYSISPNSNTHFFSKIITEFCDSEFSEFGKNFYDEFSCDMLGRLGEHTEFKNIEQII